MIDKRIKECFEKVEENLDNKQVEFADISSLVKFIVSAFIISSITLAIILFFLNIETFFWFTKEDGIVEYSTALFLMVIMFLNLFKALQSKDRCHIAFSAVCAMIFFFGFGEEISWGQRIFQFNTPEELMRINEQQEFTLHNLNLYGISFKKVLFRTVLNSVFLFYFIGFPFFYRRTAWVNTQVGKWGIPIPTSSQAILFIIAFLSPMLINEGKKWELVELAISGCLFLTFLYPYNKQLVFNKSIMLPYLKSLPGPAKPVLKENLP
ncbi:hypothetical protein [Adhaeribacter aquaticus]|uniref:hypothetical protein n=1 Tax=Adhaeribacter aquaticus TaxID=299567 RepID=UPI00041504FC|nr:hypothetical protein [Adhaeribacter aquaticus]